ncbi:MAG: LacI family DNA-binding transcriptional regulator [Sediminibacterium sp.]|nr:LacI family DNA-binding transcriptional regulator [Sediminibacterium sp.]
MARVKCTKCNKPERIQRAGIVRDKQRYYCKDCNYHFIVEKTKKGKAPFRTKNEGQTSLRDIADAAGVSTATVSRALNNKPDINEQTSNLIKGLAVSMNYQPNILAQSLVNRTTHTLGVIIPSLETTIFSTMLSGIQEVAALAGYRVIICTSNEKHDREIANIQALMNNMIDGLLICHSVHTSTFEHVRVHMGKRIPIVQFYRVAVGLPVPQILADDEAGAEKVTDYLIKKGCRKIAMLLGPKELSLTQKRLKGYLKSLEKHDIQFNSSLLAHVDFSYEYVLKALDNWLTINPDIDAIISISDKSAAQIIQQLKIKKISVPHSIRVVGFGNEFVGEMLDPQLTTFDTQTRIIGEEASRLIIEQTISGNRDLITKTVPGNLVIRDSA